MSESFLSAADRVYGLNNLGALIDHIAWLHRNQKPMAHIHELAWLLVSATRPKEDQP